VFPRGNAHLEPGDVVVVMADPASEGTLREFLGNVKRAGSEESNRLKA